MPIDYTKRPKEPAPPTPSTSGPVVLTKQAPAVSLQKSSGGLLRVNLNWNARPGKARGLFQKAEPSLDLDLGCLYEFSDGSKGVVQALGNAFAALDRTTRTPIVRLDGDDRSGAVAGGENLLIDLAHVERIRRILVFALIYEGAANWAAADGVATLYPGQWPVGHDPPRRPAGRCAHLRDRDARIPGRRTPRAPRDQLHQRWPTRARRGLWLGHALDRRT